MLPSNRARANDRSRVSELRMLRCRFCSFEVPFARKLKSGKIRMGRDTLTWHVREKHSYEYGKIVAFARRTVVLPPILEPMEDDDGADFTLQDEGD